MDVCENKGKNNSHFFLSIFIIIFIFIIPQDGLDGMEIEFNFLRIVYFLCDAERRASRVKKGFHGK